MRFIFTKIKNLQLETNAISIFLFHKQNILPKKIFKLHTGYE